MRFPGWLKTSIVASAVLCSCTMLDKGPPTAFPPPPTDVLTKYKQAQSWMQNEPAKACAAWLEIAATPKFPLANVARVRALKACGVDESSLSRLDEILATTSEPWLQDELKKSLLDRAVAVGDKAMELRLSLETARKQPLQSDQIRLLKRSIELADALGDAVAKARAETQLHATAPRLIHEPKPELYLLVAADFRRAREFDKAREFYRLFLERPDVEDDERLRALDGIRMTFKLENDRERYIHATRDFADFARRKFLIEPRRRKRLAKKAQPEKALDAQITLARAVWTENQPTEAKEILARAEDELKGKAPLDESVFVRARIEEEAGRFDESVKLLELIDTARLANRDLKSKILWYRAWNLRKVKRLPQAIEALEQLAKDESNPTLQNRNRYWLARTLLESGDAERAREQFEALIDADPLGYYGILAYRELKRPLPPLTARSLSVGQMGKGKLEVPRDGFFAPDEFVTFEWLIAASENELGRRYVENLLNTKRPAPGSKESLEALKSLARTGKYAALFGRIQEFSAETRRRILADDPELFFPQPWSDTVTESARRFDVPKELVYSIMRQESSFDPLSRSEADAFGLMQIIPEVARKTRATVGLELRSDEDLYEPRNNIQLGTAFLRGLLAQWQGRFIPVVASYNASERAVTGWLQTRDRSDPVQFIEDVPYEETRTYLKLVIRNFAFYSRLNSGGRAIEFPERCLVGIQDIKP